MVATRRSRSQRRAGHSSGTDAARASSPQRFISFAAVRWAIVAAIAAVALRRKAPAPGICPVDPAACHFSQHLDGARSLLRMRAAALKDVCNVSVSRLPEVAPGLATDAVVVDNCAGANCSTLVHLSGVHGVEGYAGSAIQSALLLKWAWGENPGDRCPPRGTKAVLIHAVNPFGMAYGRRWNEKGVDLNRNALRLSEPFEGLVDRRRDVEDAYAELSSLLNPTSWSEAKFWWRALSTVARKGFVATKRVLVSGQYSVPNGLWYGGTDLQKSHKYVLKFLGKVVEPSSRIFLVDAHTGLGPSGVDTLMALGDEASLDGVRHVFGEPDGTFLYGETATGAASGYDATIGDVPRGYADRLGWTNARGLTQEFGTVPGLLVARALVRENAAWHHGDEAEQRAAARDVRDAFCVPSAAWQASVVERGVTVARQALAGLADGRLP